MKVGSNVIGLGRVFDSSYSENEWLRVAVFERAGETWLHVRSWVLRAGKWCTDTAHGASIPFSALALLYPSAARQLVQLGAVHVGGGR